MKLQPARGTVFIEPIDEIEAMKTEVGFGAKSDKIKPEVPYKFRVVAVGDEIPLDGLWVHSEVYVGDIVSLMSTNQTTRTNAVEGSGFLIDGRRYLAVDFRDILGIWREYEINVEGNSPSDRIARGVI